MADALSRTEVSAITTVDLQEIARHQTTELSLRTDMSSLKIVEVPLPFSHGNILVDTSTGTQRPLVPKNLRHKVFLSLHSLSHPGARATSKMIRQRFVWPHMDKDIRAWCRECLSCQKSKVHRHTSIAPASFPLPRCRFQHIHTDHCQHPTYAHLDDHRSIHKMARRYSTSRHIDGDSPEVLDLWMVSQLGSAGDHHNRQRKPILVPPFPSGE